MESKYNEYNPDENTLCEKGWGERLRSCNL